MKQLVLEKENSEFKPVKVCLKIDLVSYPAPTEGLVNIIYKCVRIVDYYKTEIMTLNHMIMYKLLDRFSLVDGISINVGYLILILYYMYISNNSISNNSVYHTYTL